MIWKEFLNWYLVWLADDTLGFNSESFDRRTLLMARRLRIHLQCSEDEFNPWSRKTPDAAKQLNPWAPTAEPTSSSSRTPTLTYWARKPQLRKPRRLGPAPRETTAMGSPRMQLEKPSYSDEDPGQPKIK